VTSDQDCQLLADPILGFSEDGTRAKFIYTMPGMICLA
jgi:hypothetical protein